MPDVPQDISNAGFAASAKSFQLGIEFPSYEHGYTDAAYDIITEGALNNTGLDVSSSTTPTTGQIYPKSKLWRVTG